MQRPAMYAHLCATCTPAHTEATDAYNHTPSLIHFASSSQMKMMDLLLWEEQQN